MSKCLNCNKTLNSKKIYGLHEECFVSLFCLSDPIEFHDVDPKRTSFTPSHLKLEKKDTFFHGRYLKYSANLISTQYILKIQEKEYLDLPGVEYLCNQIARLLTIIVPPYYLINFNGRITFVTRNFMQDYVGSLQHIYKFLPKGEENYNCEEILKTIVAQTRRPVDVYKFITICLFDALIGNNDRHGRNLGIIETATIKKLAPMYDNPSFLGIEDDSMLEANFNPSGTIWTQKSQEPKVMDYVEEFKRLGYQSVVDQFSSQLISQESNIINLIDRAHIKLKRKKALIRFLQQRIGDFKRAQ